MSSATELQLWSLETTPANQSYTPSPTTRVYSPCFVNDSAIHKGMKLTGYAAVFLISLVLNSSTVYLVWRTKSMRKTCNYFIVNLAVSDLLITMVYMPRQMTKLVAGSTWMVEGIFGEISCKVVPTIHMTAILASILTLLAISVDRFCAVVFPMRTAVSSKSRVKTTVALIWFVSLAARLPYFLTLQLKNRFCTTKYRKVLGDGAKQTYVVTLLVVFCITPLLTEIILYAIAITYLKFHLTPGDTNAAHPSQRNKQRAARKLLKFSCLMTVGFIVCWTPYFVAQIQYRSVPCDVRFWRFFLAHSNSALNPILSILFNTEFCQGFRRILCPRCIIAALHKDRDSNQAERRSERRASQLEVVEAITVV